MDPPENSCDRHRLSGHRTFLARDPVIVDDRHVAKATSAMRDGEPVVQFELRPDGAKRFGDATREWTERRIAIVVVVAPIVKSALTSGHGAFPAPGDTLASRRKNADRIARALGGGRREPQSVASVVAPSATDRDRPRPSASSRDGT